MKKKKAARPARDESAFKVVRRLALKLPEVKEGTIHGAPSWKLGGKLMACAAIHKSAEPNSLLVKVDPAERTQLLAQEPETYYVTDHYTSDRVVLVRLAKIDRKALEGLLKRAWLVLMKADQG